MNSNPLTGHKLINNSTFKGTQLNKLPKLKKNLGITKSVPQIYPLTASHSQLKQHPIIDLTHQRNSINNNDLNRSKEFEVHEKSIEHQINQIKKTQEKNVTTLLDKQRDEQLTHMKTIIKQGVPNAFSHNNKRYEQLKSHRAEVYKASLDMQIDLD